jgi:uncharacterized membrane protein SirB2
MSYFLLKHLHVSCVVVSGLGFFLRGILMLRGSPLLRARWVRVSPHVVDTLLLGSAVGLVTVTGQYPWVVAWVAAKIAGLLVYIGLGTMALRRGRTREQRIAYWIAALLSFAYIVSVALTRDARGALAIL